MAVTGFGHLAGCLLGDTPSALIVYNRRKWAVKSFLRADGGMEFSILLKKLYKSMRFV